MLCCAVLYCTVLCCDVLQCVVLYCIGVHCAVTYCAELCCAILCYCTLYCAALHCAVLCFIVLFSMYCTIVQPLILAESSSSSFISPGPMTTAVHSSAFPSLSFIPLPSSFFISHNHRCTSPAFSFLSLLRVRRNTSKRLISPRLPHGRTSLASEHTATLKQPWTSE